MPRLTLPSSSKFESSPTLFLVLLGISQQGEWLLYHHGNLHDRAKRLLGRRGRLAFGLDRARNGMERRK